MRNEALRARKAELLGVAGELGASEELRSHLSLVADVAVAVARLIAANGVQISIEDILAGALLHDIGYLHQEGVQHGVKGSEIVRDLGFSESVARIVERHILGGLSKELIRSAKLDLPARDYVPTSVEEKVVAFADQLVHARSDSGQFLREDPTKDEEIRANIFRLYEDVLRSCFVPKEGKSHEKA